MYILQPRSMIVIEAYYNNKLVGKFADMNTADRILKDMKKKVSYNFKAINDKDPDFWKLLKKGFILVKPILSKEQLRMLALNIKDPDEIVKFIIAFYISNNIKSEKELISKLSKYKPLATAIELQKEKEK